MSQKTITGTIPFDVGGQTPGSANPPTIAAFKVESQNDAQNQVTFFFSASNYTSLSIFIQLLDGDASVGDLIEYPVATVTRYLVTRDISYKTKVYVTASNSNGSVSSAVIILDKATPALATIEDIISSCSFSQPANSFDKVSINLNLLKTDKYSLNNIKSITLLSKREDFQGWNSTPLSKQVAQAISDNGVITNYVFLFDKIQFLRPSIGGFFNFQIKISIEGYADIYSEIRKIFYDNISPSQTSANDSPSFPTAEIIDRFASLRYEIDAKFYQLFVLQSNVRYEPSDSDSAKEPPTFVHRFLDPEDVASLSYSDYLINTQSAGFLFYYEFNNSKTDGSTKGYMYPASVSDIYPCILPESDGAGNKSMVLFWKINKDFYDYSYFKNSISIQTSSFKVKIQCKENGSYVDITQPISLIKEVHYQSSTDKFILKIDRDVDVLSPKRSLFDQISEFDNRSDKLKIVVVEHSVACSSGYGGSKNYTFDKLLLPPKWTYIAYDKYLPKDAISRKNDKVNLSLGDYSLRGIRLPNNGFSIFDKVQSIRQYSSSSAGSFTSIFDLSVAYKISCSFNGYYKDPIIEGTVNSVVIPNIPDDVFLIPPRVRLPAPNLISSSEGGIQADAKVNLNEYGKIRAIEMIDPGGGYSLYKSQLDKRKQTFTDFVPIVISSYKVNSIASAVVKKALAPENASFDSANLKASIYGGVRLNSVLEDSNLVKDYLTESQKEQLKEYLSESEVPEVQIPENSYSIYNETTAAENLLDGIFDQEWYLVSQLYEEKYVNPMEDVSISNEDEDPAVSNSTDSYVESSPSTSEATSTPTSVSAGSSQTSQTGGTWSAFALNDLQVVPDGSPAVSMSSLGIAPPWLTLLPLSVRSDGERGYGPLPNMQTRAEMFNRIVAAINNLNEVRVVVPYVWLVSSQTKSESWLAPTDAYSLTEITFNTGGTKVVNSYPPPDDFIAAINTSFAVSAERSVGKAEYKSSELDPALGLGGGIYAVSTQFSTSQKFTPRIHPFMANAIPSYMAGSIKRRILGIVSQASYNCASSQTPISQTLGIPVIGCRTRGSDNYFEKPFPSSYPDTTTNTDTHFEFFDSGGSISVSPRGTARYVGTQVEKWNGYAVFCYASCGDSDVKTIDFSYANMFPATYKL